MKKLIITADDYGAVPHIDNAILELVKKGRVSAVSCFANLETDKLQSKIEELLKHKSPTNNFGIGLHFTVCSGSPLIKTLNSLTIFKNNKLEFRTMNEHQPIKIGLDDLKNELNAQLTHLATCLAGRAKIDHVSCHFNFCYLVKRFFETYIETIHAFDAHIPIRSPQRWVNYHPELVNEKRGRKAIRKEATNNLPANGLPELLWNQTLIAIDFLVLKCKKQEIRFVDYLFPEFYGNPDLMMSEDLTRKLGWDETTEIVVHASDGSTQETINGINAGYFGGRKAEFDFFMGNNNKPLPYFFGKSEVSIGSYSTHLNL